jgi:hypothetical protein
MKLRNPFSASLLDEFIAFKKGEIYIPEEDGVCEYTLDMYINKLYGEKKQTDAMRIGSILHKMIEEAGFSELPEDSTVNDDGVNDVTVFWYIDETISLPEKREVSFKRSLDDMFLVGKVDAISATTVHDLKFTSKVDIERYLNSYQWRAYLWITGLKRFVYNLFSIRIVDAHHVVVNKYEKLELSWYNNLDNDVVSLLREYTDFIRKIERDILPTFKFNMEKKEKDDEVKKRRLYANLLPSVITRWEMNLLDFSNH